MWKFHISFILDVRKGAELSTVEFSPSPVTNFLAIKAYLSSSLFSIAMQS